MMRHLARTMRTRSGVAPPISQVAALLNGSVAVRAIQFLLVCSVVGDNAAAVGALDAIELILACGGFQPTPRPMRERSKVIGRRIRDSWQMLRRSESNRARTREYAPLARRHVPRGDILSLPASVCTRAPGAALSTLQQFAVVAFPPKNGQYP
ncbi:MAG: hypothetical protein WA820_28315 [Bradyrhizobium sp.]